MEWIAANGVDVGLLTGWLRYVQMQLLADNQ